MWGYVSVPWPEPSNISMSKKGEDGRGGEGKSGREKEGRKDRRREEGRNPHVGF